MIAIKEIESKLSRLGVSIGDHLLVHSSLRAIGPLEGGAEGLLNALRNTVGEEGTIAMPSFCYSWGIPEPYFDVHSTPGKTGKLTEIFRQQPGTIRSLHPTHSVIACGKRAEEFLAQHMETEAFGINSPIDRIAQAGGYVLLLGVTHTANSTIHVGEAYASVRKFHSTDGPLPFANVLLPDGRIISHQIDCSSSCSRAFNAVDHVMRNHDMIMDLTIGSGWCYLMKGLDIINVVKEMINEKPVALFCTDESCRRCRLGRQFVQLII